LYNRSGFNAITTKLMIAVFMRMMLNIFPELFLHR
jgi:hypothetical protein